MKTQKRATLTITLAGAILLTACSSTPIATPAASPPPATTGMSGATPATTQTTVPTAIVATPLASYLDPKSVLFRERSVYFDFDQSAVKPEFESLLESHGKFLAVHPAVLIKVEGHTDERGGAEYNLALGQKRAESVVKALRIFGVKDSQMEAVSFGKEKPKATGRDEVSYAQNRRADLDYPAR